MKDTQYMPLRFLHTADIHLGKTYRTSAGEGERYEDFFRVLAGMVTDALAEKVDFVLIAGDLFHTGQILPRTFACTIETRGVSGVRGSQRGQDLIV